ncbi:MAG: hypothetical protein ACK4UJ_02835 [Leptonema sp. (in: bacteria)]
MSKQEKRIGFIYFLFVGCYLLFQLFFSLEIRVNSKGIENQPLIITLEKGILQKYFLEKEIYEEMYPSYLDNEHKPQRLFQSLSQEIKKNLISIFVILFLVVLIVFLLYAMNYNVSFYPAFKKQILFVFLIVLLFIIFFIRKGEIYQVFLQTQSYLSFLPIFIESILLFLTTFLLVSKVPFYEKKPFLDLYYKQQFELKKKLINFIKFIRDLIFISLVSLILVNFLLFPIFYLQIERKVPFEYLFLGFLLFLFFYYVYNYYTISKAKEEKPKLFVAISFLGYRILTNFFYFFLVFLVFLFVVSLIFSFIFSNLSILEKYNLLHSKKL